MSEHDTKIAFIGGGNMAQAIVRGLLTAGHPAKHICVTDPSAEQRAVLADIDEQLVVMDDNVAATQATDVVVLAVKPQIIVQVASDLSAHIDTGRQLILSIAAGTTLDSLRDRIGEDARIVRAMPNQPALVGKGMSGLCATDNVSDALKATAGYIMAATGQFEWFEDEATIDPLTAISGSGPAYFYLIMEIMQAIGEDFGFDADTARSLAVQTALGAAAVADQSDESLQQLRERVTSPGGTTAAALDELEAAGIRDIFLAALTAARNRSVELGKLDD